jgi:predicted unusual protein kinase regulating ubiquinone biosynthesis (AarF/ABC1/UbiB family)
MTASHAATQEWPRYKLNWGRYLRVLHFFGSVMLDVIWWELILRHLLSNQIVARRRKDRLYNYARSFRRLAVKMGGVMIKLGQFLSARLDVMPPEITDELSKLQDEVPPEKLEPMLALIEAELGRPASDLFDDFDPEVRAAASLGQVYRARLKTGERVAIKVQRPGIERLVATDLAALAVIARWTMYWSVIRKRANVPALLDEFARTLWEELDYYAEARNAERFQELFADDMGVYVPHIYPQYSSRRVLTMEDVTSIKITDYAAIEQMGVDRKIVAQRLLDIYLRMIFDFGFFHADPHAVISSFTPCRKRQLTRGLASRRHTTGGLSTSCL